MRSGFDEMLALPKELSHSPFGKVSVTAPPSLFVAIIPIFLAPTDSSNVGLAPKGHCRETAYPYA